MAILDDMRDHLVTNSIVEGATGWQCLIGRITDNQDQQVALFETGGETPDASTGTDTKVDEVTFQVRVRASVLAYDDARSKIQDVFDTLQDATISGYVYVFAIQAGPLNMGYDNNNRPELAQNYRALKNRV